jgi:hypothetical protein
VTALINIIFSCRHNEDMEKKMVQKHKEQRNKGGERENKLKKCFRDKLLEVNIIIIIIIIIIIMIDGKTRLTNILRFCRFIRFIDNTYKDTCKDHKNYSKSLLSSFF